MSYTSEKAISLFFGLVSRIALSATYQVCHIGLMVLRCTVATFARWKSIAVWFEIVLEPCLRRDVIDFLALGDDTETAERMSSQKRRRFSFLRLRSRQDEPLLRFCIQ